MDESYTILAVAHLTPDGKLMVGAKAVGELNQTVDELVQEIEPLDIFKLVETNPQEGFHSLANVLLMAAATRIASEIADKANFAALQNFLPALTPQQYDMMTYRTRKEIMNVLKEKDIPSDN